MTRGPDDATLARIEVFRQRRPRFTDEVITLAHGAGGKASEALFEAVFRPAFNSVELARAEDGAVLSLDAGARRIALTTDSYVVKPLRFPGGSIGHLAVHGTVNDLAVMGAVPRWLSAAFVIEEGFTVAALRAVVEDMATAAAACGVTVVTGDTKVVERGAADGLYVTTTGVGELRAGVTLGAEHVRVGDGVVLSGPIAAHGMAVLLARGDLALQADIRSDTGPVHGLVASVLDAAPSTRWFRDPTRGGVASTLNELAVASGLGVVIEEASIPVDPAVVGACELLGIDPLHVANEGRLLAVVSQEDVDAVVAALRAHPSATQATVVGRIVATDPGMVVARTAFGGERVVDRLVGDPLPRIC